MTRYVLGFIFGEDDDSEKYVLLIRKNRPEWQRGKLNGIGGHIKEGETPRQAMMREAREETTIKTVPAEWSPVCVMEGLGFQVYIFAAMKLLAELEDKDGMGVDEGCLTVEFVGGLTLDKHDIIPNLLWLVPKALASTVLTGTKDRLIDIERPFSSIEEV